ncbi:MAG: hypothetical protein OXI79_20820 [Gammaproteobacteria bacterium]|nr:hypothetical protein [Gammaproteobacteria bacterium]
MFLEDHQISMLEAPRMRYYLRIDRNGRQAFTLGLWDAIRFLDPEPPVQPDQEASYQPGWQEGHDLRKKLFLAAVTDGYDKEDGSSPNSRSDPP